MTDALANLSAFERDVLWILANNGEQTGVDVRNALMDYYDQPVNHGQLYPNLDELVDAGLVEKREIDGRTNGYSLTEEGRRALSCRRAWEIGSDDDEKETLVTDGGEPSEDPTVVYDVGNRATPSDLSIKNGEYEYVVLAFDGDSRLSAPDGSLIASGKAISDLHIDGEIRTSYGDRHVGEEGGDA